MRDFLRREYKCTNGTCVDYEGHSFKECKFEECLRGMVKEKFEDAEWVDTLTEEAVKSTGFSEESFIEIFENREVENHWRIGELVAESVLERKYNVRFYYNASRDSKNLRTNLTGADLIGFCDIDNDICFLFSEVKTSEDEDTPPNVLYGKTGMVHQLENLKTDKKKRHDLVKWIWSKAIKIEGKFKQECSCALSNYVQSDYSKIQLVGVLVRDTQPNERDLKSRARALHGNIPVNMKLKLISLYTGLKMKNGNWENAMNRGE